MKYLGFLVLAWAGVAQAAEPTVTLTQGELGLLLQGAAAQQQMQQLAPAMNAASPVMDKVKKAFQGAAVPSAQAVQKPTPGPVK